MNFLDAVSGSSTQFTDISAPSGDVYYQLEVISPSLVSPSKAPESIQKSKKSEYSTTVSLISYNSSRSNLATNVVSGVNDLQEDNNKIKVYPSSVRNELRIDFDGSSTFEIFNLMGQVVYTDNFTQNAIINTSVLSSGVYLMRFEIGNSYEYKKIIKE